MPGPTIMRLPGVGTLLWLRLRLNVTLWRYRSIRCARRQVRAPIDFMGPPPRR